MSVTFDKTHSIEDTMTTEERASLVLAFARALYVNGQSTDETVASAERLGSALGVGAKIIPRWGELEIEAGEGIDRPGDMITTSITTTVVMVVAGISPQHAWSQPILRLVDTLIGIAVGITAVWIGRGFHSLSHSGESKLRTERI